MSIKFPVERCEVRGEKLEKKRGERLYIFLISHFKIQHLISHFSLRLRLATGDSKGLTLVELLVVIAVIGVLATIVTTSINPQEQVRAANDTKRKTMVNTLAKAVAAYSINNNGSFPTAADWMAKITLDGSVIQVAPEKIPAATGQECTTGNPGQARSYCYNVTAGRAIVYSRLQKKQTVNFCTDVTPSSIPFFVWRSQTSVTVIECIVAPDEPPAP